MDYYAKKRFAKEGNGVTQPCQILYINYFNKYLIKNSYFPQVLSIKKLTFKGAFNFSNPYLKLINKQGQVVYNTRDVDASLMVEKNKEFSIVFTQKHFFTGDMTLELKEDRLVGRNLLISYNFNTAFVTCSK
jgi:phosphatidylinositol-3,4,5-trisphosphate 3-phosphatase and dual-specificity protein phosphatase PTEN